MVSQPGPRSPAAERLLTAAMRLFAEKGYEGTSVGEIQEAAGLTYGSGALYKHFPSKQAVLEAGVRRFVESAGVGHKRLESLAALPIEEAVTELGRFVMAAFRHDEDELRIVWRDLDRFPELQRLVTEQRIQLTMDVMAHWLEEQVAEGRLRPHDTAAMAAVAAAPMVFIQLLRALLHHTPGGMGDERFVAAWSDLVLHGLLS
jgi:AcrR family transcriptional regulator